MGARGLELLLETTNAKYFDMFSIKILMDPKNLNSPAKCWCPICGIAFQHQYTLALHKIVHTQQVNFDTRKVTQTSVAFQAKSHIRRFDRDRKVTTIVAIDDQHDDSDSGSGLSRSSTGIRRKARPPDINFSSPRARPASRSGSAKVTVPRVAGSVVRGGRRSSGSASSCYSSMGGSPKMPSPLAAGKTTPRHQATPRQRHESKSKMSGGPSYESPPVHRNEPIKLKEFRKSISGVYTDDSDQWPTNFRAHNSPSVSSSTVKNSMGSEGSVSTEENSSKQSLPASSESGSSCSSRRRSRIPIRVTRKRYR